MPTSTFIYEERGVDIRALYDGIAGILLDGEDEGYIEIRSVILRPTGGEGTTATANRSLTRITAMDTDSVSIQVIPIKYDTDAADLPAQVTCFSAPNSVTTSDVFRRRLDCPAFVATTANSSLASWQSGRFHQKFQLQSSDFIRIDLTDGIIGPIILNEGEGIAINQDAFARPHADAFRIEVRNVATGNVYIYRSRDVGTPGRLTRPLLALFNDTGSGIVLEVLAIEMLMDGESTDPQWRLVYIVGALDYEQGTAVATDTSGTALSSNIRLLRGPFVARLVGEESGIPTDWYTNPGVFTTVAQQQLRGRIRQRQLSPRGTDAGSSISGFNQWQWYVYQAASQQPGLIIKPGEGIAMLAGREGVIMTSIFLYYNVEIIFNYITPEPSGGGGTSAFAFAS